MKESTELREKEITILAENAHIEGEISLPQIARLHGSIKGTLRGLPESEIVLAENAVMEGNIEGDQIYIDGYVRGDIEAKTRVEISQTGRVIGNIYSPDLRIHFGAYFEGKSLMDEKTRSQDGAAPLRSSNFMGERS